MDRRYHIHLDAAGMALFGSCARFVFSSGSGLVDGSKSGTNPSDSGRRADALQMVLTTRSPEEGLIHHSDRGSQYASLDYQKILQPRGGPQKGVVGSMSRRGNCYDNAPTESWFATLKRELVYRKSYTTHAEARQDIFEYIEVWRPPRGITGRENTPPSDI